MSTVTATPHTSSVLQQDVRTQIVGVHDVSDFATRPALVKHIRLLNKHPEEARQEEFVGTKFV